MLQRSIEAKKQFQEAPSRTSKQTQNQLLYLTVSFNKRDVLMDINTIQHRKDIPNDVQEFILTIAAEWEQLK